MQILMELLGAGLLIFVVVKGIQALFPAKATQENTSTTKKGKSDGDNS